MRKEEAAYALADAFISEFRKHDFRFPSINKIQNTKWWVHFERAAEQRFVDDWNAIVWVKCQFEKNGKIYPHRLYGKVAEETFNEYKHRFISGQDDREKQMISAMLATYNLIKKTVKKDFVEYDDYVEYFSKNIFKVKRNQLSKHFLSICRPFREGWEEFYDEDEMIIKRASVYKNKKLKEKLIGVMQDSFY